MKLNIHVQWTLPTKAPSDVSFVDIDAEHATENQRLEFVQHLQVLMTKTVNCWAPRPATTHSWHWAVRYIYLLFDVVVPIAYVIKIVYFAF